MKLRPHQQKLAAGDRVRYSRTFLQFSGTYTEADGAMRNGEVIGASQLGSDFVLVRWDDEPQHDVTMARCNVWPTDHLHLEPR